MLLMSEIKVAEQFPDESTLTVLPLLSESSLPAQAEITLIKIVNTKNLIRIVLNLNTVF